MWRVRCCCAAADLLSAEEDCCDLLDSPLPAQSLGNLRELIRHCNFVFYVFVFLSVSVNFVTAILLPLFYINYVFLICPILSIMCFFRIHLNKSSFSLMNLSSSMLSFVNNIPQITQTHLFNFY